MTDRRSPLALRRKDMIIFLLQNSKRNYFEPPHNLKLELEGEMNDMLTIVIGSLEQL